MTSKSGSRRPSISTARPFSTTRLGSGSFGPFIAIRPSSGQGSIRSSRRSSRCSRLSKRLGRGSLTDPKETPLRVHHPRLTHEGGRERSVELVEPGGPGFELLARRAVRPEGAVDLEDRLVVDRRQLGGPGEVVSQGTAPGSERDCGLAAQRLGRCAQVLPGQSARAQRAERDLLERETGRRGYEIGPLLPERIVGGGVEYHRVQLRVGPV